MLLGGNGEARLFGERTTYASVFDDDKFRLAGIAGAMVGSGREPAGAVLAGHRGQTEDDLRISLAVCGIRIEAA